LKVDDPHDVDDGDEATDDERRDEDDLLPTLHAERREDGQREEQDGKVGEDVDRGRQEVERDDVDARPVDHGERSVHRAALEDVEEGEDDAGDVDDDHGEERGVAEKRVGGRHAVVEDQDRRLGRHERGVVQDREGVGAFHERRSPL
jgi:hypothetical protein